MIKKIFTIILLNAGCICMIPKVLSKYNIVTNKNKCQSININSNALKLNIQSVKFINNYTNGTLELKIELKNLSNSKIYFSENNTFIELHTLHPLFDTLNSQNRFNIKQENEYKTLISDLDKRNFFSSYGQQYKFIFSYSPIEPFGNILLSQQFKILDNIWEVHLNKMEILELINKSLIGLKIKNIFFQNTEIKSDTFYLKPVIP